MKRKNWIKAAKMTGSFVALLMFASLAVAGTVDNETCLGCHDEYDASLKGSVHQLTNTAKQEINCISCHAGGVEHADDPSIENISNPKNLDGEELFSTCTKCHIAHVELDNYGYDAHSQQSLNCSSCHKVHNEGHSVLLDDKANFCLKCHNEQGMKFNLKSSHPVKQNILTCLSCHKFTKRQDYNQAYDFDRICQDCHPEQGGPFLYEHDANNAHAIDGGGCIECHDPHGTENDKLLKMPSDNLCQQCHYPRNHFVAHDGYWGNYSCQTCHIETHGSFNNRFYLDPDLPVKLNGGDCYQDGCHSINE